MSILQFRLTPRSRGEANRSSSSLELMFDLATVVAVAAAANGLAQDVRAGLFALGIVRFCSGFFMAWLAWVNYTWFASGYGNRSTTFRALTMIIIFGSLTLAGGMQSAFDDKPIWLPLVGFIIMRLGMIALWLGAANGDRRIRPTALFYATGIAAMQLYWCALISAVSPQTIMYFGFFVLGAAGELAIPAWAERKITTNWHHDHIIDRHNLFNIIVIGECFAAIAAIIANSHTPDFRHFWLASLCFTIAFSMWALYFDRSEQLLGRKLHTVLAWAYGHYVVFAAGAATAAGFSVYLSVDFYHSPVFAQRATLAISVPIALYLSALWLVRDRFSRQGALRWLLLVGAALIIVSSVSSTHALEWVSGLLVLSVITRRHLLSR
ncbi:low temperature requirement protein A [Ensifer adhaerens]|uniref:low temperature requirement protein A n=1 Tax=Ensifer adhaerens TaxID=106592 RepID=UPI001CBCDCF9|nr:low temperature requirement protein A [Ensifer adhaerens]MBZ7927712.1 low temperature requirement protein A [Ensifer adhaerens]UAX96644.1 low temperature requirement protein A [Ensifer adhaerens]UAY04012.1 low temperature requirement protein A [Ensifer adhaerens]UAY11998.1 low temperature requirement protein A [Ensifer adhaerens]